MSERFFAIDMFAQLDGHHGGEGVQVVRSRDHHRVDAFVLLQHFAKILVTLCAREFFERAGGVRGERGQLIYCGYDINDLAGMVCFEEVVLLLWEGRLPYREELQSLQDELKAALEVDKLRTSAAPNQAGEDFSSLKSLSGADFSGLASLSNMDFSGLSGLNGLSITIK